MKKNCYLYLSNQLRYKVDLQKKLQGQQRTKFHIKSTRNEEETNCISNVYSLTPFILIFLAKHNEFIMNYGTSTLNYNKTPSTKVILYTSPQLLQV